MFLDTSNLRDVNHLKRMNDVGGHHIRGIQTCSKHCKPTENRRFESFK